jgi:hypothetical protein
VKTAWKEPFGATVVVAMIGCGLAMGGGASIDDHDGGASSGGREGESSASGSSGAVTLGDGSTPSSLDQGPVGDGPPGGGTTNDAGSLPTDSAVGDAGTAGLTEAGPSRGTMDCPPGSDSGACDLSSNVCCTCPNCFAPYPTQCFPAVTGCVGIVFSGVYARLACGDSTNCAAGSVCCAEFNTTPALIGSSCRSACSTSGAVQLCTSSGECAAGKTCQPVTSIAGFSGCQ